MNVSYFIARRLLTQKGTSFSRFIIRLSTIATAVSVAIMIIAVAVVLGFKATIKDKMFVFWSHIQITPFNPNPTSAISPDPFNFDAHLDSSLKSVAGVTAVYPYALKPAIVQAGNLMEGIKMKGVTNKYPLRSNHAIDFKGTGIQFPKEGYSRQILLSTSTLHRLNKHIGDTVLVYFLNPGQDFPSIRKLQIAGKFHTGMEEIDTHFGICDIRLLRRVAHWDSLAINGYQVAVNDYRRADAIGDKIYQDLLQPPMNRNTMKDLYPNIFSWLGLMNTNAYIILTIMAIVAMINMATALLIFILERTRMTGILKTLGMPMKTIQKVFLYHASIVALKGILWGTLAGILFCLLQDQYHLISLDESAYYMQYAPVKLVPWQIILIDTGTLLFCVVMMLLPLLLIRSISIIKAIRFK